MVYNEENEELELKRSRKCQNHRVASLMDDRRGGIFVDLLWVVIRSWVLSHGGLTLEWNWKNQIQPN